MRLKVCKVFNEKAIYGWLVWQARKSLAASSAYKQARHIFARFSFTLGACVSVILYECACMYIFCCFTFHFSHVYFSAICIGAQMYANKRNFVTLVPLWARRQQRNIGWQAASHNIVQLLTQAMQFSRKYNNKVK